MDLNKKTLIKALNSSIKDLQQGIDRHCRLVTSILEEKVDKPNLKPFLDLCPSKPRELVLKNALKETIDVLEESRRAFKSKQLESLRKRLTEVLIDAD
ncbi:MAG: hypothetical protein J7K30_01945 [Deltaproteobacteria bacterium]|nr:hypothetical protein [Deltaproteobacteria bacterium]